MAEETGFDFRSPFDDDSHTFQDGALQRYFRMRKWFFACGLALLMLDTNWLEYGRVASALAVSDFPKLLVQSTLTVTGAYLLAQAGLVATQIWVTYPLSLETRLRVLESKTLEALDARIANLVERRTQREEVHRDNPDAQFWRRWAADGIELDAEIHSLSRRRKRAGQTLQRRRTIIVQTEVVLDVARVVPTIAFLAYAIVRHGTIDYFVHMPR